MVLMIGELMKAAERYLGEGTHPRVLVDVSSPSSSTSSKQQFWSRRREDALAQEESRSMCLLTQKLTAHGTCARS
eukprot:scaffold272082_cov19-Tisochrysis_lutea.AAC.1